MAAPSQVAFQLLRLVAWLQELLRGRAGINLASRAHEHPRLDSIARLEAAVLAQLPPPLAGRFRAMPVVAASKRLARAAEEAGFARVVLADGPRPAQLMKAACTIGPTGIR